MYVALQFGAIRTNSHYLTSTMTNPLPKEESGSTTFLVDSKGLPIVDPIRQGTPWWQAMDPNLRQECENAFLAFLDSEAPSTNHDLPLLPNQIWTTLRFECLAENDGSANAYKITVKSSPDPAQKTGNTKEGRYQKRYKELLKKMNLLMSSSQQICWDWDLPSDAMRLVGPEECILGYSYPDIAPNSAFWFQRIHPDDSLLVNTSLQNTIRGPENIWESEYRCKNDEGDYLWIKQIGVVTKRSPEGNALAMIGTTQLIERKKQAEHEKLQLLQRYRAIVEAQGDAVARIDSKRKLTFYNSVFAQQFLHTTQLDLDLDLDEAIRRSPCLATFQKNLKTLSSKAKTSSFIADTKSENGTPKSFAWQACLIEDESPYGLEIQFSGRDISPLQSLEKALVSSNRENQAKDRFLAMISHDLRTPLNPILGFSELIARRPNIDQETKGMAQRIGSAAHQLNEHINSLLEISKMDSELYSQESSPTTLAELRDDFESNFTMKAEHKGLTFLISLSGNRATPFATDLKLLRNILNNLIDNAIKFTHDGKVMLCLRLQLDPANKSTSRLTFKVVDEGVGIPHESMEQIFEPFVRVDTSNSRETEGAGLGLSICRRSLEILGGNIEVASNPTGGTTFSGFIPVDSDPNPKRFQPDDASNTDFSPPASTRILIVDDIESNRIVLNNVLADLKLNSETCPDGASALEQLSHTPYDIVFLDIHMPRMNGIETLERLKQQNKSLPYLVAVTADATPQIKQACSQSGIDGFITKPISRSKINKVLGDFRKQRNEA